MSILYSILKSIIRKAIKENLHQESYEEFARVYHELQAKFKFRLPQKKGYEFRDEIIDGWHCIVGHKSGSDTKRALLHLVGGANRRYHLPRSNIWTKQTVICGYRSIPFIPIMIFWMRWKWFAISL